MNRGKVTVNRFGGINEYSESFGEAIEMVNLFVTKDGNLKKRCDKREILSLRGEKLLASWEGTLRGIECVLFVTNGGFYKYLSGAEAAIFLRPFSAERAFAFEFGECVYILSDTDLYLFDGGIVERVEGYAPIIAINTDSSGSCELFEAPNMLTPRRRQRFSTDGSNVILRLLEKDIESIISVSYLGEVISPMNYAFVSDKNEIMLDDIYPAGENTIEVEYSAKTSRRKELLDYRRASVFGGGNDTRVFLFGSEQNPSYRRHSEIGDGVSRADYFPENNFVSISGKVITSIIRHYDRQLIFCLDSTFYSVDEIRTDSFGNYYHSFPIYALNSDKGHIGGNDAVLINNEPLSITYDGIYKWVSTNVRDERNAIKISEKVDGTVLRFLMRRDEFPIRLYDDDIRTELWIVSDDEALIYNYGLGVWYFYDGIEFVTFSRCFDKLFLGSDNGMISVFEETTSLLPIRYISGTSALGAEDTQKDIGFFSIDAKGKSGEGFGFELIGDDEQNKTTLSFFANHEHFRRRLTLRRKRRLRFCIEGNLSEFYATFISFIFKERGRLF